MLNTLQNLSINFERFFLTPKCTKKVVSDSLGLVDFAVGLVIFVNLSDGQVLFFWEIQITEGL